MTDEVDPQRFEVRTREDGTEVMVMLWYPRHSGAKAVQVGLMDVRAAADLRIAYDFARDGWVIERCEELPDEEIEDGGIADRWVERAFVRSFREAELEDEEGL